MDIFINTIQNCFRKFQLECVRSRVDDGRDPLRFFPFSVGKEILFSLSDRENAL